MRGGLLRERRRHTRGEGSVDPFVPVHLAVGAPGGSPAPEEVAQTVSPLEFSEVAVGGAKLLHDLDVEALLGGVAEAEGTRGHVDSSLLGDVGIYTILLL